MANFERVELLNLAIEFLAAGGTPETVAREVAESLVLSNLLGVDSHGVVRIKNYLDSIELGAIVPDAEPSILAENSVLVRIAGRKAFGQLVAKFAMRLAMEKARKNGIGGACFTDVYHIGRLGEYVTMAAESQLVGLMFANGSRPGGLVAPFGARERVLGTNPIAFAIPAGKHRPLVADFSTSSVAEGIVRIAARKHQKVQTGCLIDQEGKPTTGPNDLYAGGAILTFGAHKGYALSLLVEVLGGLLSGAETPIFPDYQYMHNGVFMLAIDPSWFRPWTDYQSAVDFLFDAIKQARPAHGMSGALIPGEPESANLKLREEEGIPVDDATLRELSELAVKLKIEIPCIAKALGESAAD
jgi:LDH2 family malate/lactate/ureidoglycolate dehydrogenase